VTAWDQLFAARAGRTDCLLVDALRARAVRLYPRDEEKQDSAVTEFWSHLIVSETPGSVPVLARYDGERPLVPWLIRVFQNWHISQMRMHAGEHPLPDDDVALPLAANADGRWHEAFCLAARQAIDMLSEVELLILGLRLRYRLSQREVAALLGYTRAPSPGRRRICVIAAWTKSAHSSWPRAGRGTISPISC